VGATAVAVVAAVIAVVAAAAVVIIVVAAAADYTATRVEINVIETRPSKRSYNLALILLSRLFVFTPYSLISRARFQ